MPADAPGPFGAIALTLSGGGARAVGFHLGVLAYLDRVGLLEDVEVLSTVSGGTFIGTSYALSLKEGVPFAQYFADAYRFVEKAPFFPLAIKWLTSREAPLLTGRRTLATSIARAWDSLYFKGKRFEIFWRPEPRIHLREIMFNATEFKTGIGFRFQKSASEARIGNGHVWIRDEHAKMLRMADIMAASSAIPGGVEPLAFPQDFAWPGDDGGLAARGEVCAWLREKFEIDTIPLMDGGVYDNQGVESVLLAEARREHHGEPPLGLIVISDTPVPTDPFYAMPPPPKRGQITFTTLNRGLWGLVATAAATVVALIVHFLDDARKSGVTGAWLDLDDALAFVVPMILALALGGSLLWVRWKVRDVIDHLSAVVGAPWRNLKRLTTNQAVDLVNLRIGSTLSLTSDIFMNRIRELGYRDAFSRPGWRARIMANEIYDVVADAARREADRAEGDDTGIPGLPDWLAPSPAMVEVARIASTMGTKLWLQAPPAGQHGELDALVACGQMTTCFNLVRHMATEPRKADGAFDDPRLNALWAKTRADWLAMSANPYAFVPAP